MLSPKRLCMLAALILIAPTARAAVIIDAREVGADVIFTASGSLNLAGLTAGSYADSPAAIWPDWASESLVAMGEPISFTSLLGHSGATPMAQIGAGGYAAANSATGDNFFLRGRYVFLPPDYQSGAPLQASATYVGRSFASLGLTPGVYTQSWASDYVTLRISVVPLPAAAPLLLGALGLIGAAARREG